MPLKLTDAVKNNLYFIQGMALPVKTAKRLEALGMTSEAQIIVLNKKKSALIAEFRGTRFALGKAIAQNIFIKASGVPESESGGES